MPSLLSHCISRRPSLAMARARSLRARPSRAGFDLAEQHILVRRHIGEIDVKRAVCVARIAEVFVFLALLQDDDALAELRGAVRGDEAGDAGPDHDHVVLDICFGHRPGSGSVDSDVSAYDHRPPRPSQRPLKAGALTAK